MQMNSVHWQIFSQVKPVLFLICILILILVTSYQFPH